MELWSGEFVSEIIFSNYCSFDSCDDVINPKLSQKGPKPVFHVPMVTERWNPIVKGNSGELFAIETTIHNHQLKNGSKSSRLVFHVSVLIHETGLLKLCSFDSIWWRHQPKIGSKKGPNSFSFTNGKRKIKVKSKRNFEVRYSFMRLFSRDLEIPLSQNWTKKTQICISCTTGGKNIKIKNYNFVSN